MTEFLPEGASRESRGAGPAAPPHQEPEPGPHQADQAPQNLVQAPAYAPPSGPAWTAPPPQWTPEPPKKRKAWPWIVGIVGGLVVLGGVGAAIASALNGALNADQNENYTGSPITDTSNPTMGDLVVVSDDGLVAFDAGSEWVSARDYMDTTALERSLPPGAHLMAVYFVAPLATATDHVPTLVTVLEGSPPGQVGPADIEEAHEGFVAGGVKGLDIAAPDVIVSDPVAVTTANGLDGMQSTISMSVEGTPIRTNVYTFARGETVVFVQIMAYTDESDEATAALVTDTLRIDK